MSILAKGPGVGDKRWCAPEVSEPAAELPAAGPEVAAIPGVESTKVEEREIEAAQEDITDSLFESYKPQPVRISYLIHDQLLENFLVVNQLIEIEQAPY